MYVAELATPQKAPLTMPEGGLGIPQFSWEDVFDSAGWFLTGYGDNVSLGLTGLFRHSTGLGNVVPYHRPAYIAGSLAATAVYLPSAVVGTVRLAKMGYKVGAGAWAGAQAWRTGRTVQLAAQSLPKAAKLADDCSDPPLIGATSNGIAPPNLVYSAHYLKRSANTRDKFHNFPMTFDDHIVREGTRIVVSDSFHMYVLRGVVNGRTGVFEIGVEPFKSGRNARVTHRFFKPDIR